MTVLKQNTSDGELHAFRLWTEHYPLLSAEAENKWLSKHETLYYQLVKAVHAGRQKWFAQRYIELDLSKENWLNVLWAKRPYMKDVLDAVKQDLDKNKDKALEENLVELAQVREHLMASNIRLVMKLAHKQFDDTLSFFDLVQEGSFGLMRAIERFETNRGLRFSTYATHWITQFMRLAIKKNSRLVRIPTNVQDQMYRFKKAVAQAEQERGRGGVQRLELIARGDLNDKLIDDISMLMQPVSSLHSEQYEDTDHLPIDDIDSNTLSPEAMTEQSETYEQLNKLLAELPARDRLILQMRYGIDMPQEYGYREIADQLDLSRERVRQIEGELVKKLRQQNEWHERLG